MAPESKVTPEAMVGYRATARRRQARVQQELRTRQARAWALARRAAALLKTQFGARHLRPCFEHTQRDLLEFAEFLDELAEDS